jgi:E3 ubiquitin-protein ligase SIAH1
MASTQVQWEFLEELKCPVCLMYMTSAIRMCENGHNVCSSCKERLTQCPTCRGKFVNVRNITLEKLAAISIYPCANREVGCEETFIADDRDSHLAVCLFQSRECPFRKLSGVDCPWTGTLSDIVVHIVTEHDSETVEVPAHFKVDLLDFVEGICYRRVVNCLGEIFYLTWERDGDILRFGIFHFGPKYRTNDFKYGIKIGSSEYCVSVTRKCLSYLEGDLKELQHTDCVTFYYNTILYCLNASGYLSCEIEIGREKLDGFVLDELQEFLQVAFAIGSDSEIGREKLDKPPQPEVLPSSPPPLPLTRPPTTSAQPTLPSVFLFGPPSTQPPHFFPRSVPRSNSSWNDIFGTRENRH